MLGNKHDILVLPNRWINSAVLIWGKGRQTRHRLFLLPLAALMAFAPTTHFSNAREQLPSVWHITSSKSFIRCYNSTMQSALQ